MTDEAALADLLFNAQTNATRSVDESLLSTLDRAAAYRIATATQSRLGETTGMLKTAVAKDGVGVAAPIFASRVGRSGSIDFPASVVLGLEVEVGVVLAQDVGAGASDEDVAAAVDYYFTGVEVIGTRFVDRSAASPGAGLADFMSAYGYVIGPRRAAGAALEGSQVVLQLGDETVFAGPAKHGFGTVLASVAAYARAQQRDYPLKAGTIITTGSLCGLVPTGERGHVVARLDDQVVEFDIV